MVAIAKKMFLHIEFREGDAQNLPFADASFDRVLANFALLHLADPARAWAEAFRVLKSGGKYGFLYGRHRATIHMQKSSTTRSTRTPISMSIFRPAPRIIYLRPVKNFGKH
jgi:ubiquinone/menaquinone biosynthesis C-methylase UbiE